MEEIFAFFAEMLFEAIVHLLDRFPSAKASLQIVVVTASVSWAIYQGPFQDVWAAMHPEKVFSPFRVVVQLPESARATDPFQTHFACR